jgi:ribosomal protein L40E
MKICMECYEYLTKVYYLSPYSKDLVLHKYLCEKCGEEYKPEQNDLEIDSDLSS